MKKLAVKSVKTFAYGFFPTGFAVLVSFAVAKWGFENMYYMGQFLPAFMFFYLLLAWFIYLRRTSFLAWNLHEGKPVDPWAITKAIWPGSSCGPRARLEFWQPSFITGLE